MIRATSTTTRERRGFTLVELLISVSVFLVLTGMTLVMVNNTFEAERLRSGARQVQSFLGGARDRAVYANEARGVRFLYNGTVGGPDPEDFTVNSMVYIRPLANDVGTCEIQQDATPLSIYVLQEGSALTWTWPALAAAGVLNADSRIHIALGNTGQEALDGITYTLDAAQTFAADGTLIQQNPPRLVLSSEYIGTGAPATGYAYELTLDNAVLPNSEPVTLPEGIVINLGVGKIPSSWASKPGRIDLLFSPRGVVTGTPAAQGIIHLVVCDLEDVVDSTNDNVATFFSSKSEADFLACKGGIRIATIFTRTGRVVTNEADPNSGDPFNYALGGEETGE